MAVIGFGILQSNGKSPTLNKPFLLELNNLYFLVNNTLKCYLCLFTGHIYTNYPFLKEFFNFIIIIIKLVILKPITLTLYAIIVGKLIILTVIVFI